ncbi:annexin A3 [Sarcophilus harrisii]|uniref:annexin A3 n=1 Tax=Sarcophilus harrisii TaxID=9305 RepID=UPI001301EF85|nr:annexin A3 [Sarcophilus harrisii]
MTLPSNPLVEPKGDGLEEKEGHWPQKDWPRLLAASLFCSSHLRGLRFPARDFLSPVDALKGKRESGRTLKKNDPSVVAPAAESLPFLPLGPQTTEFSFLLESHGGDTASGQKMIPSSLDVSLATLLSLSRASSTYTGIKRTTEECVCFNAFADAEVIQKCIQGIRDSEQTLIGILTARCYAQRQLIAKEYRKISGKDLKDDLKTDLTGNFERLLKALITSPATYDAKQLKKAMKSFQTDDSVLIEILTTRNNKQLKELSEAYFTEYKKNLVDDLTSQTSGYFRKALILLTEGKRDESLDVNKSLAKKDAQILYEAGEKRWGTDEDKFIEILCLRSFSQLRLIFEEYKIISQREIEDSIKREMSGHLADLLLAIVNCVKNTAAFFAEKLYKALKATETDKWALDRIIVSRSENDLLDIQAAYKKQYGSSLHSDIKSNVSGRYEAGLVNICGKNV